MPDPNGNRTRSRETSDAKRPPPRMNGFGSIFDLNDIDDRTTEFIPEDFLKTSNTGARDSSSPFDLITMLKELLIYHTTAQADAQTSSILLLLLMPLLPETSPLSQAETDSTLSHYLEHLTALSIPEPTILSILDTDISHLLSAGLSPLWAESILTTYHTQLLTLSLLNNAAFFRRLSYPAFPSVYDQALKDNQIHLRCGACKKPMPKISPDFKCESCKRTQRPCPVCWCRESPFEAPPKRKKNKSGIAGHARVGSEGPVSAGMHAGVSTTADGDGDSGARIRQAVLYSTCLVCNHSAHAACLATWHGADATKGAGAAKGVSATSASDGACPTEGCLCDCVGGGGEGTKEAGGLRTRKKVREDEVAVGESKAVTSVRRSLGAGEARLRGSRESLRS